MATCQEQGMWAQILEKGVAALADELSDEASVHLSEKFGSRNYKPLPVNASRAEGARIWDGAGNEYIDCIGAYSAMAHGHLSPAIVRAVVQQMEKVTVTSRAFYNSEVALFLHGLATYCDLDMCCPMNSGAEAIETCLKLARKWGYTVKGVPQNQAEIIVFEDNFHGRTITVVGFSTEEGYKTNFGPFTPGFKVIPFGDLDALKAAITPNTVAILAEPIQAEGGILIPPDGFLQQVRQLCTEENVLLIWDEIQTGFCRTGKKFAWQYEDAKPDLMAVGKPLGGGILPVSAAVGTAEVVGVFRPGDHGSTFGGNPLGAAVALTALAEMEVNDYAGRSARLGAHAVAKLRAMPFDEIKEVRGRGLLIGVELDESVDTNAITHALMDHGILTKQTRHRTFRLTPPITIEDDLLDEALDRFEQALASVLQGTGAKA
ncbi:MAG: ornithine--oxo-acid transaminase [Fimbriimonadaceae bacterium]|nr:ornithine--oxo-acid transaminase [Fimbriimonadaceae bacterium]